MRKILLLLAAVCLFAAACGGSDSDDTSAGDTSTTASSTTAAGGTADDMAKDAGLTGQVNDEGTKSVADGGRLEVEVDDRYFGPTFIKAPAGAAFTLALTNAGDLPHTFTVDALQIDEQLEPGQAVEVEVTMPDATTAFYCNFHADSGMQGALVVDGGGSSGGAGAGSDSTTTTTEAESPSGY